MTILAFSEGTRNTSFYDFEEPFLSGRPEGCADGRRFVEPHRQSILEDCGFHRAGHRTQNRHRGTERRNLQTHDHDASHFQPYGMSRRSGGDASSEDNLARAFVNKIRLKWAAEFSLRGAAHMFGYVTF